ncbi:ribonuclease II/R family protein [Actinidia rufa]|uniref:Ribonuclease II/R family protein n=1 Tax=Actinidia rufa TaxID=165716 RepID=A0A7J0E8L2_9ERIC|nr:ribonuclease II/R family protein [Actinidia rufa]
MTTVVRAMNTCSIFRSASSPPLAAFTCRLSQFGPLRCRSSSNLGFRSPIDRNCLLGHGGVRSYSVQSLVETVMEELHALRKRKGIRASVKMGLKSSGELIEDKLDKQALQKGFLLEFKKDSERVLLAVAQRPDGKKNWMVSDQNGVTTSIKPQQITFIVPGVEDFDHTEISDFIQKAQNNLDPSLLEFAWIELLEENKSVTVEELAEMIFGSAEPLESYCAHLLLSEDEIYFTVIESKGSFSVYGPRPAMQVEEKIQHRIKSLEAYAVDACQNDDQKKAAGMVPGYEV